MVGESPYFKYSVEKDLKMEESHSATPDGEVRDSLLLSLFASSSLFVQKTKQNKTSKKNQNTINKFSGPFFKHQCLVKSADSTSVTGFLA